MKKICVVGLGYIGLPTSLLFATNGYNVVGIDVDANKVESINRGTMPFEEAGFQCLLNETLDANTFRASKIPEESDIFLIAVPTPFDKENRMADLHYVIEACRSIAPFIKKSDLIVIESTIPPGTCENCVVPILENMCNEGKGGLKVHQDFYLAHCPERAIPGNTYYEMVHNDRIVGGIDEKSALLTKKLYQSFVKGDIFTTSVKIAEIVKLMENTYRDINIALANEFAQIADEVGINVWEAIELANKHPRVNILKPGPGVGGHCIAVDPWFLTEDSTKSRIISLSRDINDGMPKYVLHTIKEIVKNANPRDIIITVFGVAYKGNIDDTRETPALKFILLAEKEGYTVNVYDPHVKDRRFNLLPLRDAVRNSDCIVVITDHNEFSSLPVEEIGDIMKTKNIYDTRNCLDHKRWENAGFAVKVLGK